MGNGLTMNMIYQSSDLAGAKRTEFLNDAREGRARLRDKDGTSLVMLPERDLDVLEHFARWSQMVRRLEVLNSRQTETSVSEFGELAWLRVFDEDDRRAFVNDVENALLASLADNDYSIVESTVSEWRITARQLEDPLRRSVLLGTHDPGDFSEVAEPRTSGE